ncbi:MAG: hypothetical protein H7835_19035 [Magnetococcus sp. XQGC-1]
MWEGYLFTAYCAVSMFAGALVSKALAVVVAFNLGLIMVYPDEEKATLLAVLFVPAVLLAAFRD